MSKTDNSHAVERAWAEYDLGPIASIEPIAHGLINKTFRIHTKAQERYVLQCVNRIFAPGIHSDIDVVTRALAAKGVPTPRLLPTRSGRLYVDLDPEGLWRVMTHIDGVTHPRLERETTAKSAGSLLARFHAALATLDHRFENARLGVHDTPRHLGALRDALDKHKGHGSFVSIAPLADEIFEEAAALPALPVVPDRAVHGDPKISNILFDAASDEALCFVDLDTLARMPLPLELGDAFRSWCNPAGEESLSARFELGLFRAAIDGYASAADVVKEEWQSIVSATRTITVELAARFCADALNERYFGWDPMRFSTRSEHNSLRAQSQLGLARSLRARAPEAEAAVFDAFSR